MKESKKPTDNTSISRRTVLASATLIPLAAIATAPQRAAAQAPATALTVEQRKTVDAFVDRIIPKDELGPSAAECGVGEYIDRCLADYLAAEKPLFLDGLANLDVFALRTQGIAFSSLPADKRDAVLMAIDDNQAPQPARLFQSRAAPHARRHVRRPGLRRQQKLRRLGSDPLPRCQARRQSRRPEHEDSA